MQLPVIEAATSQGSQSHIKTHLSEHRVLCHEPLLFSLLIHDITGSFKINRIIKLSDNTTLVGLIRENDETAHRK